MIFQGGISFGPAGHERKPAAILRAGVLGYARLMGDNKPTAPRTFTGSRQIVSWRIGKFREGSSTRRTFPPHPEIV